jgi:hypothetical protein
MTYKQKTKKRTQDRGALKKTAFWLILWVVILWGQSNGAKLLPIFLGDWESKRENAGLII